jgi:hypothetical protein
VLLKDTLIPSNGSYLPCRKKQWPHFYHNFSVSSASHALYPTTRKQQCRPAWPGNTRTYQVVGLFIGWIVFAGLGAWIAARKYHSAIGFFLLGLVLTPIIGIIAALVVSPNKEVIEREAMRDGTQRRCPFCAELVRGQARVCRYCGRDIPPLTIEEKQADIVQNRDFSPVCLAGHHTRCRGSAFKLGVKCACQCHRSL